MGNSNIQLTVEQLSGMNPLDIVSCDAVRSRFIQIYDTLWGEGTGLAAYEKESIYFNRILSDNEKLRQKATRFSIFVSFIDLAVCGLSLEPGTRAQCYLQGRNYCVGKNADGSKKYEARCSLTISGYGELVLRARCGQIKYADNPVLVYSEDEFSFSDKDGRKSVDYTCHLPHTSGHVIAAFLRITRNDGSIDYSVMYEEDWMRLATFSAENNKVWDNDRRCYVKEPNPLYVSNNGRIDTGFLCAKLIKHAFKSYPKVKTGKGTELESQQEEQKTDADDFYGVDEVRQVSQEPASEPFGGAERNGGVQIQTEETDDTF